jgi:hypothetical protein
MTAHYESILRKSLDTVDRKQKWMKPIALIYMVLGSGSIALAMIYLQDLKSLYIATFTGLILVICGLAIAILRVTNRNTRMVLQAIALLSESTGTTTANPTQQKLDKRED